MVKDSLKTLLNSFPWFFNKSEDSNFYKSQEVSNRRLQDLYQSLFEVYNSFHLGKKCLIWKDQSEPYNYQINFVANFPHLKTVTCLKNDAVIYSEHYEYEDNVDSFLYIYDSLLDNDTSDDNVEESETETQEIPIIPQDTFKIIIETYEEYIITKGFPENDEEQGNEFDHDISLDEIGAQNNIPRKTYKITDDYENTEPAYNDRLSEDDYHYMNRIINYVLRIHNTPLPVLEIWKEYGIFSDMINREQYLFKMFDEKVHPDPDWVPMPWEHKDTLCNLLQDLGRFFFVSANTLLPVKNQSVIFNFRYLNSLAETLTGDYNVTITLLGEEEDTVIVENYNGGQYTVTNDMISDEDPNVFKFEAYEGLNLFATEELTVTVRGCTTADWYVSPNGDDTNDGETINTPFKTIGKALSVVDGERNLIVLTSGTYTINEALPVSPSSTVLGCGNVTIENTTDFKFFKVSQNNRLNLQGITLKHDTSLEIVENSNWINNNKTPNQLYVIISEGAGKTLTILSIDTDKSTYTIGETIEITGTLTDDEDTPLSGKSIKIYVNNELVDTVTTANNTGEFSKNITATTSGTIEIRAVFEGDEDYRSNSGTEIITVNKKATTITFNASKSSYALGETITLSGSLKTGTTGLDNVDVKIYDGETLLDTVTTDNGTFDKTLTASIVSSKTYKAIYEGDATYASATSSDVNVTIVKRTPTISLLTSSASVTTGDSYTLSGALLYNGSGLGSVNIKLYDGNTLLDTLTTGNDGTFSKSITSSVAGTFSYKVIYEGDATYNNVESSTVNVVVSDRPVPDSIDLNLTAGKQILSYADRSSGNEYATLTATVVDENDNPCEGETVSFSIAGTVVKSDDTDANGHVSYTYNTAGVGNVTVEAAVGVSGTFLTKTYELQDCWKYYDGEITSYITPNLVLPNRYTIEYEIIKIQNGTGSASARLWIGNSNTNLHTGFNSNSNQDVMIWQSGLSAQAISGLPLNTWGTVTLNVDDTNKTVSITFLGTTKSLSNITGDLTNLYAIGDSNWNSSLSKFRNIMIKPL